VTERESKPPPKRSRKRRVLMLLAGVTLGLICRVVPPEYQAPCSVVVKLVGLFMGAS